MYFLVWRFAEDGFIWSVGNGSLWMNYRALVLSVGLVRSQLNLRGFFKRYNAEMSSLPKP